MIVHELYRRVVSIGEKSTTRASYVFSRVVRSAFCDERKKERSFPSRWTRQKKRERPESRNEFRVENWPSFHCDFFFLPLFSFFFFFFSPPFQKSDIFSHNNKARNDKTRRIFKYNVRRRRKIYGIVRGDRSVPFQNFGADIVLLYTRHRVLRIVNVGQHQSPQGRNFILVQGVVILDATGASSSSSFSSSSLHPFYLSEKKKKKQWSTIKKKTSLRYYDISNSVSCGWFVKYISRFQSDGGKFDRYRKRAEKQPYTVHRSCGYTWARVRVKWLRVWPKHGQVNTVTTMVSRRDDYSPRFLIVLNDAPPIFLSHILNIPIIFQ